MPGRRRSLPSACATTPTNIASANSSAGLSSKVTRATSADHVPLPVCQAPPGKLSRWHETRPAQGNLASNSSWLGGMRDGPGLVIAIGVRWNQPAQSPFGRFAAAQVEGGSGVSASDEPTALREVPADAGIGLVVDDEPAIVESLTKIFRREGLNVLSATDGTAGLDLLRKHRVGVLLTDLMMPNTSGMDLLRAAKTIAPETEVVLMTAYGTVEPAVAAMKEGAYAFVTVPLLRDRRDVISLLAQHFVHGYAETIGKAITVLTPTALERRTEFGCPV